MSFGKTVFVTVLLVSLNLTLPLLLAVNAYAQVEPSQASWEAYVANLPTPQAGCFVARYPNEFWQQTQCVAAPSVPMKVGGGGTNDWTVQTTGKDIGQARGSFITSGITSEKVGSQANSYSLQINSNPNFPVTYYGKATKGWQQFVYLNRVAPSPSTGLVYIEYWLFGYYTAYGSCPPASQNPPGASGWIRYGGSCYSNLNAVATPFMTATQLADQHFYAYANFKGSSKDEAKFCFTIPTTTCYAVSVKDSVLSLYKYWAKSEFNVFGNCCGSEAIFNKGASIDVVGSLFDQTGTLITPACLAASFTGETNNLNLGSCGVVLGASILFNEHD